MDWSNTQILLKKVLSTLTAAINYFRANLTFLKLILAKYTVLSAHCDKNLTVILLTRIASLIGQSESVSLSLPPRNHAACVAGNKNGLSVV